MVLDLKKKNIPSQETLYGWFPGGHEPPREDSREIYIKLGSRPPRDQSYYETNILFQYHQSLNPSQREYTNKQSASEVVKPPWSLHEVLIPNTADNADEINAKNFSRAKSAPNVPTQRLVLKIPNAQLNNIFDVNETLEGKQPNSPCNSITENINYNDESIRPKSSYTPVSSVTPDRYFQSRASNNESRLTYNENKTVNENNNEKTADVSSKNHKTNDLKKPSFSNLMNDIIDSKYLENIQNHKHNEKNETIKMETTDKYDRISRSKSAPKNSNLRVEVKNIGKKSFLVESYENTGAISHNKFRPTKTSIKNARPKTTMTTTTQNKPTNELYNPNEKYSPMKQRAGTAPIIKEGRLKTPNILQNLSSNSFDKFGNHYTLSDYHRELLLISPDKKPITGTTSQLSLSEKLNNNNNKTTNTHIETQVLHTNKNSFNDVKLVDGHWKDQLLNRGSYLQKRPKYCVKSDPEKLKIDPPLAAFDTHNSSETYFYNTIPIRKTCYTVNPHFISENLNVKKMDLQNRLMGSSAGVFGPVKYRRDYAFVY